MKHIDKIIGITSISLGLTAIGYKVACAISDKIALKHYRKDRTEAIQKIRDEKHQ